MRGSSGSSACDNEGGLCRAVDKPRLPRSARLPINRCNLPADIVGSLSFQARPCALAIDGVVELHHKLFAVLDSIGCAAARAERFEDYLTVHFRLDRPEEMGFSDDAHVHRHKVTWLRLLRGWMFDSDSIEAAALKGWVESRFGLLPRYHRGPLREPGDRAWRQYEEDRARGVYGTAGLEAQIDLLYAYAQYEFERRGTTGLLTLYRGTNRPDAYEVVAPDGGDGPIWLLNNLNSFSASAERAGEFGDRVIRVQVPSAKVLCHGHLFPRRLKGEEEYLVIGGLYRVAAVE